jgi:hypothetical protein
MRGRFSYRGLPRVPAALAVCLLVLLAATPAFAFFEGGTGDPALASSCQNCHPYRFDTPMSLPNAYHQGPHADYSTISHNCPICHSVHPKGYQIRSGEPTGTYGIMLLPKQTVKASCETCHDGTGGAGVYGSIAARGLTIGAQHRIDTTNVVPGGDAATGGSAVTTFSGVAHNLSCDDCHDPHNGGTVNPFIGDRQRINASWPPTYPTSRLLRQKPTGATTSTADYGSDWCAACHKGRLTGSGMAANHPVDSRLVTTTPFTYSRVAILATIAPTASTVTTFMGGTQRSMGSWFPTMGGNRGFLMPLPGGARTPQQQGHFPICQQCHEDSRFVGTLAADGSTAQAATSVVSASDGASSTDNPRFQNFPHETQNPKMLVENGDDLCTNCHPASTLP